MWLLEGKGKRHHFGWSNLKTGTSPMNTHTHPPVTKNKTLRERQAPPPPQTPGAPSPVAFVARAKTVSVAVSLVDAGSEDGDAKGAAALHVPAGGGNGDQASALQLADLTKPRLCPGGGFGPIAAKGPQCSSIQP